MEIIFRKKTIFPKMTICRESWKMKTSSSNGWNIVNFNDDNTVAAVPDTWLCKDVCAWPKAFKDADKIIESRMVPNDNDFYYYSAKNMSKKTYSSLAKAKSKLPNALLKSEISSTEDEVIRVKSRPKYKLKHASPSNVRTKKFKSTVTNQHESSPSVPPIYIPSKDATDQKGSSKSNDKEYKVSDSSSSSAFDDSDGDPTWGSTPKNGSTLENAGMISPFKSTPVKSTNKVEIMSSPSGLWKVSQVNKEETPMNSFDENKSINISETNQNYSAVKKKVQRQLQYTEVNHNPSHNQISDLYNMCLTSFSFIKYEVGALKMFCHTMNENIEALMKEKATLFSSTNDNLDIETLFPIKNNEDLLVLEDKIKNKDLRNLLVSKISLFVGKKDVGNSVRRIMSRMFDDHFLVNYSLYGFKQKQSFTKLSCYRLIIDALRVHVKYKLCTEKEIDEPLGTWLSHAPYRVSTGEKKPKTKTMSSNDNSLIK